MICNDFLHLKWIANRTPQKLGTLPQNVSPRADLCVFWGSQVVPKMRVTRLLRADSPNLDPQLGLT